MATEPNLPVCSALAEIIQIDYSLCVKVYQAMGGDEALAANVLLLMKPHIASNNEKIGVTPYDLYLFSCVTLAEKSAMLLNMFTMAADKALKKVCLAIIDEHKKWIGVLPNEFIFAS